MGDNLTPTPSRQLNYNTVINGENMKELRTCTLNVTLPDVSTLELKIPLKSLQFLKISDAQNCRNLKELLKFTPNIRHLEVDKIQTSDEADLNNRQLECGTITFTEMTVAVTIARLTKMY